MKLWLQHGNTALTFYISFFFCNQDSRFTIYLYPSVVYVDKSLLGRTVVERDPGEFGKHPQLVAFDGNQVSVRRADGSLMATSVSPYPAALHSYATSNRWSDATRLCR